MKSSFLRSLAKTHAPLPAHLPFTLNASIAFSPSQAAPRSQSLSLGDAQPLQTADPMAILRVAEPLHLERPCGPPLHRWGWRSADS